MMSYRRSMHRGGYALRRIYYILQFRRDFECGRVKLCFHFAMMSRYSDMDPFSTPPPRFRRDMTSVAEKTAVPVSKSVLIAIIQSIPFDNIFLPDNLVNDDTTDITRFIEALGAALIEVMISKSPRKMSPRKLVALQYSSDEFSTLEQDTPIKRHLKETDVHARTKRSHPEPPGTEDLEPWNPFKGLIPDEIRAEMLKSISLEEPQRRKFTRATNTLTRTDPKINPLPSIFPFEAKPLSDDDRAPPEVDAKRMEWLKEIDLDKDPYYMTRLERKPDELHPHVFIRGQVIVPKDQNGKLPAGFDQELYEVNDLALLDYGADCRTVCADFQTRGPCESMSI